ncbi:hypothetical protein GR183_06705 [Stappia sp. GBMRC 2046]|uniref:Uncharacterized protein n=1 Tax=Stappia sediminis TaxID=2692190 RepID=A0A7X3S7C3_9HYPH|nr:hypothetical protein [Stappia sediminis]MXN64590.1 hypothetical protein [Stappia sediminis]
MLIGLMVGFSTYAEGMAASFGRPEITKNTSEAVLLQSECEGVIFRDEDPGCFAIGRPATTAESTGERTVGLILVDFLAKGRFRPG